MPYATYTTPVNASFDTIWNLLLDKAQNPERYIPYKVDDLKILERGDNTLTREIKTPEMHMTERVVWDKSTGDVVFHVENHPLYEGTILNKVTPADQNSRSGQSGELPLLTFTMDLKPRTPDADSQPDAKWFQHAAEPEAIKAAVLHVKDLMEQTESGGANANLSGSHEKSSEAAAAGHLHKP